MMQGTFGVGDNADEFPNNAAESRDSDGDGVGDNSDMFPNDASESMDTDGSQHRCLRGPQ